jgi:methionine-rich copper-binding protein CopC
MRHLAFIAALLAAVACAQAALAHAFLESASPKVGGRVADASEVRLTFSEPVEPAFSTISVTGPPSFAGAAAAKPAGQDHRTLAAALKAPAPPGRYLVRWRVLSRDSHVTQGSFRFEVGR